MLGAAARSRNSVIDFLSRANVLHNEELGFGDLDTMTVFVLQEYHVQKSNRATALTTRREYSEYVTL